MTKRAAGRRQQAPITPPQRKAQNAKLIARPLALIALAGINSLLGYARDLVLAAWYGASPRSDAFFVGSFVPLLVGQVVVLGSLVPAFLPVLADTTPPARAPLVRAMLAWGTGGGLLLAAGIWWAAPALAAALAPGLAPAVVPQAVLVLRFSLPLVAAAVPTGVLAAALQYQGRFVVPALGAAAPNAGILLALGLAGPAAGLPAAALGLSTGALLGLLLAAAAYRRVSSRQDAVGRDEESGSGTSHNPQPATRNPKQSPGPQLVSRLTPPGLPQTLRLAAPLVAMLVVTQIVALVERILAAGLAPGSVSLLAYALKLDLLPVTILAGTLTTILFPRLSRAAAESRIRDQGAEIRNANRAFGEILAHGIGQIIAWTLPAAAWLIVCAEPAIQAVYGRGSFTVAAGREAARLLVLYATGLVPLALLQWLPRAYHARQNTGRPLGIYAGAVAGYSGLAALLIAGGAGAPGLAAAFSLYTYGTVALFAWDLRADLGPVAGRLARQAGPAIGGSLALAAVGAGLQRLAGQGLPPLVLAGGLALTGLATYAGTWWIIRGRLLPQADREADRYQVSGSNT